MTRSHFVLTALLSLAVACGSSKDDDKAKKNDKKADDSAQKSKKKAPEKKPAGLPTKLDCATLVPTDVAAKHFPGATVTQFDKAAARKKVNLPPDPATARCDIDTPEWPITVIDLKCGMYLDDDLVDDVYAKITGEKRIEGVGRAGGELPSQISIVDDDTACIIVLSYLGKHRDALVALAKDIVPLLTPAAIGAK
jgi:hypothetical protein